MHTDKDSQYGNLSQELRLDYDNDGFKWIAGIYGDRDQKDINTETFSDFPSMAGVKDREIDGTSYAVFTNLTFSLSQRFSLVGGLRYETEEQTFGAQYRFRNGLYARADLIGYGEMYFDKANEYKRDAYQIVKAKIGYEAAHFDLYLYGKNIFDEQYDSFGYWSGYYTIYSDPGEVGVLVTYRF